MQPLITYIKNPKRTLLKIILMLAKDYMSDELCLKLMYRVQMGEPLNLDNPKKFTEKVQWLKLYNRKPEYTTMVDKYAVKDYVAGIIGREYIIPTLGVWDKPEDIDWEALPDRFVLKTTHGGGGGGVVICSDKAALDKADAIARLNRSLKSDIYHSLKEWPYKDVRKRIIAEQFMEDTGLHELRDYKFFCFGGQCRCMKVDFDRFIEHHANYYDTEGNLLRFGEKDCAPDFNKAIHLPDTMPQMVELANKLSKDTPLMRVDFYDVDGKVYFGELTFFPASGMGKFTPEEYDSILGQWIELPNKGGVSACK